MSEPNKIPDNPLLALESWFRTLIREEIRAAMGQNGNTGPKHPEATKPYFTVRQAAKFSCLGESTIRLAIRRRELKAHQVGSRVIIKRTDLERFLEAHPIEILSD